MAHGKLRGRLSSPVVSQNSVWSEVSRKATAVGAGLSETAYLGRLFEDEKVKREVDGYAREITLPSSANGMAALSAHGVVDEAHDANSCEARVIGMLVMDLCR